VPGVKIRLRASGFSGAVRTKFLLRPESRSPEPGFKGSVVGIPDEVQEMYTGTMIKDLMAMVERAERREEQRREIREETELRMLEAMYYEAPQQHTAMAGAA
jgi:hypothetical protein